MKVSPHYTELKFLLTSTYETLLSQSPWWFEDCDANTHCSVSEGWLEISLPSRVCLNYLQLKIRGAGKRSPAMGMAGLLPGMWVSLMSSSMTTLDLLPVFRLSWIKSKGPGWNVQSSLITTQPWETDPLTGSWVVHLEAKSSERC